MKNKIWILAGTAILAGIVYGSYKKAHRDFWRGLYLDSSDW